MAVERYTLSFNTMMKDKPVLYNIGKNFDLVTVIEKASLSEEAGWMQVALQGDPDEIQRAVADLNTKGVFVAPVELAILS
jgi:hypothetical protein